jgi:hypothetical protein
MELLLIIVVLLLLFGGGGEYSFSIMRSAVEDRSDGGQRDVCGRSFSSW